MTASSRAATFADPRWILITLASAAVLGAGAWQAPERVWSNLLVVSYYLLTLALGGAVFMALTSVTHASWHIAIRRIPEAMAIALAPAAALTLAVLAAGMRRYAWQPTPEQAEAGTFWFKQLWSEPRFWMVRAVVYVVLWGLLARILVGISRRQDISASPGFDGWNRRLSGLFLLVFAPTFALASCDWLMLLDPLWFSTIWGVYHFAGMVEATLAAIIVLGIGLRSAGVLRGVVTTDHLHDLAKLLLGFSCFWMYLWFSQYMLIWYTNIPEETSYYLVRMSGPWGPLQVANLALNWFIPFFALLPRPSKRSQSILIRIALVVLMGRWLDLYLMVFPATLGETPVFGLYELAGVGLLLGASSLTFVRAFGQAPAVPQGDPRLADSLHYHC